jgi:hypothetical protein
MDPSKSSDLLTNLAPDDNVPSLLISALVALILQQVGKSIVPVCQRLPPEFVMEIFLYFVPENKSITIPVFSDSEGMPWKLGQICSPWRQIALNDPWLWSRITINGEGASLPPVKTALLRGGQPLLIFEMTVLEYDISSISPIQTYLLPYMSRLTELNLVVDRDSLQSFMPFHLDFYRR